MIENDELAKLIVTQVSLELIDFPPTHATMKRIAGDNYDTLMSKLETAIKTVLDEKRSY